MRWVSEWFYDKLTLNNSMSGELNSDLTGTISSVQAGNFYKPPAASGILQLRSSSGKIEQINYTSHSETNGIYTFAVSATLLNPFQAGDRCSTGDSLITGWNVYNYTGTNQNELFCFIPDLTLPAVVISSGNSDFNRGRAMDMSLLVIGEGTTSIDEANYEAQNLVDKALQILDLAYESKLQCRMKSCQPMDVGGVFLTAFDVGFDVTEESRSNG